MLNISVINISKKLYFSPFFSISYCFQDKYNFFSEICVTMLMHVIINSLPFCSIFTVSEIIPDFCSFKFSYFFFLKHCYDYRMYRWSQDKCKFSYHWNCFFWKFCLFWNFQKCCVVNDDNISSKIPSVSLYCYSI